MDPTSTQTVMKRQLVLFSHFMVSLGNVRSGEKENARKTTCTPSTFRLASHDKLLYAASFAKCFGKRNESEYPWEIFMIILFKSS